MFRGRLLEKKYWGLSVKRVVPGLKQFLDLQHTVNNPRVQPYIDDAKERLKAMEPERDWRPECKRLQHK
jgi:hypothetical protein